MLDAELAALIERAGGRFPEELYDADSMEDVEPALLDAAIMGIASHYLHSSRSVSGEHRDRLIAELSDLDRIYTQLPTDTAREYFDRTRAVARYILDRRGPTQRRRDLR